MSEETYGPLITIEATILFGWLLIRGFKTGTMEFPQAGFTMSGHRRSQPARFWLTTVFIGFLTLASAVATIGQVFFARFMN